MRHEQRAAVQAVVLADTHIGNGTRTKLSRTAWDRITRADVILHAGDIVGTDFLQDLRAAAPVHAVLGNNDVDLVGSLPETVEIEMGGVRLAMIHDSGPRRGREHRLWRRFPTADVVVFGHSHIPWNAGGVDGQLLFNPGSATQRRRQPHRTLGVLQLHDGEVRSEIVVVDEV